MKDGKLVPGVPAQRSGGMPTPVEMIVAIMLFIASIGVGALLVHEAVGLFWSWLA